MSVKFEQETVKKVQNVVEKAAESGPIPGTKGKHPIAAAVLPIPDGRTAAVTGGADSDEDAENESESSGHGGAHNAR